MIKRITLAITAILLLSFGAFAQGSGSTTAASTAKTEKPKKPPIFRANKEQITEVQNKLKTADLYNGETTGKLDTATRTSIKKWQSSNGLKQTGTINRATLEKMGVELTEKQKEIPVSPNSFAEADNGSTSAKDSASTNSSGAKPKKSIFRASKEQITEAQKIMTTASLYKGAENGKLDTDTRAALKKYQEANGLKATGTLNRETLEKMGVALTDKQKADAGN